ncbi:hypothetical protein [Singulisphaera sp. PoT]|uniref:hypothetical protein n=1 Tax=Singulisphaera sp. PoT TaxID=3411797 RepID=UPI003BF5A9C3
MSDKPIPTTRHVLNAPKQAEFVERYLASEEVANREESLDRSFDCLIQATYEAGEVALAIGLIALTFCRRRRIHDRSASSLLTMLELDCEPEGLSALRELMR